MRSDGGPSREFRTPEQIDPTAEHRELLHITLADKSVANLIANLNAQKTGLVLSGGGGKGSYQAGALLALYDCGFTNVSAIAGTSVGALNAALFHELFTKRDRTMMLRMWANLTHTSVFALSLEFLSKLCL